MTQIDAYYAGRNSWFPGERIPTQVPAEFALLATDWKRGLRNVLAEERLNLDSEWDKEAGR